MAGALDMETQKPLVKPSVEDSLKPFFQKPTLIEQPFTSVILPDPCEILPNSATLAPSFSCYANIWPN
jgi:hypothetical protein